MKKLLLALVAIAMVCLIAGCGQDAQTKADKKPLKIVTSFYPLYIDALNLTQGINGVEVQNMTSQETTGCLHDYQLTPEDMKRIESANIFIINGAGMESFMDNIEKNNKDLKIVDASEGIKLIEEEEGPNPHVWVSVTENIKQVENIRDQLIKYDPEHADQYKHNAQVYIEKLEKLKKDMHAKIDPLKNREIVTFHEAFPYFAQEFNLKTVGVIEREPGTVPSPAELADTIKIVKSLPQKALFAEPQYSSESAKTIANETGAKVYTLDPVATGPADDPDAYIKAMQKNADTLAEALS